LARDLTNPCLSREPRARVAIVLAFGWTSSTFLNIIFTPLGLANNKNVSTHSSLWLKYVLLKMSVKKRNIKENPNLGEFTNAFRKTLFM
jgi:hypothetical protein